MELDSESQDHPQSTLELERHHSTQKTFFCLMICTTVIIVQLYTWLNIPSESQKAKRWASHLEIFVSIRLLFGAPLAGVGSDNRFSFPTFAADFRYFMKELTHLVRQKTSVVPVAIFQSSEYVYPNNVYR